MQWYQIAPKKDLCHTPNNARSNTKYIENDIYVKRGKLQYCSYAGFNQILNMVVVLDMQL